MTEQCCERNNTKTKHTRHTRDRQYTLRPEEQNCENNLRFIIINPLGRIPGCMNKPFQYSAGAYMLSYSKGSEIPVYCRVCPKPSFPSYHKKGMLPRLQGTVKLKAVSRLFGRTPRLQGRSARAERPICRHISATLLTLQLNVEELMLLNCGIGEDT